MAMLDRLSQEDKDFLLEIINTEIDDVDRDVNGFMRWESSDDEFQGSLDKLGLLVSFKKGIDKGDVVNLKEIIDEWVSDANDNFLYYEFDPANEFDKEQLDQFARLKEIQSKLA